jgi:aspartate-semialdehyde dehydrogenase
MTARLPVSVLGATGVVGQRLVRRLADHPWFELAALAASDKSAGKRYAEACTWRAGGEPHAGRGGDVLVECAPERAGAALVFSALDAGPAREIEPAFAAAGALVCSNASAARMEPDVPLLVPEVNPGALDLLETQRRRRATRGAIVCNPNCTTAGLVLALAPLAALGLEQVLMVSLQAASGAGYPGVAALDLLGNAIPYIAGEEEKVECETKKILAERAGPLAVSAHCNRVAVPDGHSCSVSVRLSSAVEARAVLAAWSRFRALPQELELPSAPRQPIWVHSEMDRPQPRLDVEADQGMPVHVGRLRPCPILGFKFQILSHNLERGAAGAAVLNAELLRATGRI